MDDDNSVKVKLKDNLCIFCQTICI